MVITHMSVHVSDDYYNVSTLSTVITGGLGGRNLDVLAEEE